MNQWIWLIFITCDKHWVNMKTRLNVIVYFLFLNGAKRGVGNISVGNYFAQEVFRRFFRKWKSPLRDIGGNGVRGLVEYHVRPRTSSLTKPYGLPLFLHFRVRAYARTRVCRALYR